MNRKDIAEQLARAALRGYFDNEGGFIDMSMGAHIRTVAKVSEAMEQILQRLKQAEPKPTPNFPIKYAIKIEWIKDYKYRTPPTYQKLDGKILLFDHKDKAEQWIKGLQPHNKIIDAQYNIVEVSEPIKE